MPPRFVDPERRFFLREPLAEGARPALLPEDEEHALRALRMTAGKRLIGLDGRGAAWPLGIVTAGRRSLVLEQAGEPELEPEPGSSEASRPRIELHCALPKPNRIHGMVDRLTQLGVRRIAPIVAEQSANTGLSENRLEKLVRVAREACKQSGNLWLPELAPPRPLYELAESRPLIEQELERSASVLLAPNAETTLAEWAATERPRDVAIFVGPEGGLRKNERKHLIELGVQPVRLTPTVLRIETAAELAVGTLNQC